ASASGAAVAVSAPAPEPAATSASGSSAPAGAAPTQPGEGRWFEGGARPLPTPAGSPAAAMTGRGARGPSQSAFAFGVAKEVAKELFPLKKVLLVVVLLVLAWLAYRLLSS